MQTRGKRREKVKTKERIVRCRYCAVAAAYLCCSFVPLYSGDVEFGSLVGLSFGSGAYERHVYPLVASCFICLLIAACYALRAIACSTVGKAYEMPLWAQAACSAIECLFLRFIRRDAFAPYGIEGKTVSAIIGAAIFFETLDFFVRIARGRTGGKRAAGIVTVIGYAVVAVCLAPLTARNVAGKTKADAVGYFTARIEDATELRDGKANECSSVGYYSLGDRERAELIVEVARLDREINRLEVRLEQIVNG